MDPFGRRLYDELRRLGRGDLLTSRLDYAEIQALKAADRAATLALFRGSVYAVLQRVKEDSPEELAAFLVVLHQLPTPAKRGPGREGPDPLQDGVAGGRWARLERIGAPHDTLLGFKL